MKGRILLFALALALPSLASCQAAAVPPTPTPEVFIPLDKVIPDSAIMLGGVQVEIAGATLSSGFPAGCSGGAPCTTVNAGSRILSVTFVPRNLPAGNMLPYKDAPDVRVVLEGGVTVPYSLTLFDNASQSLTLGFQVPADARAFGLRWGDLPEIPLNVQQ